MKRFGFEGCEIIKRRDHSKGLVIGVCDCAKELTTAWVSLHFVLGEPDIYRGCSFVDPEKQGVFVFLNLNFN